MSLHHRIISCVLCALLLSGWMIVHQARAAQPPASSSFYQTTTPTATPVTTTSGERDGKATIVFVHGWDLAAQPAMPDGEKNLLDNLVTGCDQYWKDILKYMNSNQGSLTWKTKDFRTIKYYKADTGCTNGLEKNHTSDLHAPEYTDHCTHYPTGYDIRQDGTWNEDLYHLSCLFAWYMNTNFVADREVALVVHSMGGLIVHNAIYQIQRHNTIDPSNPFPSTLGNITDVIDFSSPHSGHKLPGGGIGYCKLSLQCRQMDAENAFTKDMGADAKSLSQAEGADWTLIGSLCDQVVPPESATFLGQINHKIIYDHWESTCYSHVSILSDGRNTSNSWQYRCDWQDRGNNAATCDVRYRSYPKYYKGLNPLNTMLHALWSDRS